MSKSIASWERRYFAESDGVAHLFYVAFGKIVQDRPLDGRKYRCSGIPAGFQLMAYDRSSHGDFIGSFLQDYIWEQLKAEDPSLARQIEEAPGCVVLRGSRKNPETLDYLRDCVGLLTYFLDNGACAIFDPQMFHWWSPQQWRERIFDPAGPVPRHHVIILYTEEKQSGLFWVHTRGMRKFGRPDISVRRVGAAYRDAVIDMCQRFIEYQAFGAVIPEEQSVQMASLPPGGVARHGGDLNNHDFNNFHVEIVWPDQGLSRRRS